jgi:CheY-like chemotaxis protein
VRDTGPGIAPDVLQRIFEPYFTTKHNSGGTGLGLSVVQGLVTGYGGTVTAWSELGRGSTFDVWLAQTELPSETPSVESDIVHRGAERILLVDDEESLRDVGKRLLTAMGYDVRVAADAQEALDILRAEPTAFDLVATDQTMPKGTGLGLAAKLRDLYPSLKILLMSGFSDAIQGRTATQLGVDALLTKPFTVQELGKAVREAFGRKSPQAL